MPSLFQTERLDLREFAAGDAEFIFELLNTPKFRKYIGDRGVHSVDDARAAIEDRYRKSYVDNGFGFYVVELRETGEAVGICGFVKRDFLDDVDIGFAFLPEHEGKGYGYESAAAAIGYGSEKFGFSRLLAITSLDNDASVGLLKKLGFSEKAIIEPQGERLRLFSYTY
ncbi:MAG: GNAT family N-acetyltransferase [Acidobacteria bacterium]|nr:GNAT family N-acetyltransferase [Acidobacteriota bacterium]